MFYLWSFGHLVITYSTVFLKRWGEAEREGTGRGGKKEGGKEGERDRVMSVCIMCDRYACVLVYVPMYVYRGQRRP